MNIDLGNYRIGSDELNLILYEKKIVKDAESKNLGQERLEVKGYYNTFDQLIHAVLKRGIQKSEVEGIEKIKNEIDRQASAIIDLLSARAQEED